MIEWIFVDDVPEDRASFVDALSIPDALDVTAISGLTAKDLLSAKQLQSAGVLMDVDLSNEQGMQGTGLGLAADIRSSQYRGSSPPFPIIRFSLREAVEQNVGHDVTSDDTFDFVIEKDDVTGKVADIQQKMRGSSDIYSAIGPECDLLKATGLSADQWSSWGDTAFADDLRYADRAHLKAAQFVKLIRLSGILIDPALLATRLGLDAASKGFQDVLDALAPTRYAGVGADYFPRWWARGVEAWWDAEVDGDLPMSAATIGERIERLSSKFSGLSPLILPPTSLGERPWRFCSLSMERSGEFVPVDPLSAVPYRLRGSRPDWADPTYAALGVASKDGDNPRLDKDELERLMRRYRQS